MYTNIHPRGKQCQNLKTGEVDGLAAVNTDKEKEPSIRPPTQGLREKPFKKEILQLNILLEKLISH